MSVMPARMDAHEFSLLIPHKNKMMLLDHVDNWDDNGIYCSTLSHTKADNPLRVNGKLSYIHTIEYGAQAAAIHLALMALKNSKPISGYNTLAPILTGYLAVTRNFTFADGFLDDHPNSLLHLKSEVVSVAPRIYQYKITAMIDDNIVAEGLASVVADEIQDQAG